MNAPSPSIREQANAVECCHLEWRNDVDRLASLPVGKGGIDAAALKLKRARVEALRLAAANMHRWADKVEGREAAE